MNAAGALVHGARNALLLGLALLSAPVLAQEQERMVQLLNAYRESPGKCEGVRARPSGPLSRDARLAGVELGRDAGEALRAAGLHIVGLEAISIVGPASAEAAMQAIQGRYCSVLAKPEYTLVGISREGNRWRIVLARPRLSQDPAALAGAGRKILDLANAARAKPRKCGATHYRAAAPLAWNAALAEAARAHSSDMASHNYFAHAARDGTKADARARRAGYRWQRVGENIAAGQDSAQRAVDGWVASPGHCANLMDPRFTEMGAAYAIDQRSDLLIYWTQVFGTPR